MVVSGSLSPVERAGVGQVRLTRKAWVGLDFVRVDKEYELPPGLLAVALGSIALDHRLHRFANVSACGTRGPLSTLWARWPVVPTGIGPQIPSVLREPKSKRVGSRHVRRMAVFATLAIVRMLALGAAGASRLKARWGNS